jgi:hypothetical protein
LPAYNKNYPNLFTFVAAQVHRLLEAAGLDLPGEEVITERRRGKSCRKYYPKRPDNNGLICVMRRFLLTERPFIFSMGRLRTITTSAYALSAAI